MKKIKFLLLSLVALTLFSACGTTSVVPVTGRKHTLLVSDAEVLSLSNQEYTKYMRSAKRSSNAANTAMVQRVGKRLATAVEGYLRNNGMGSEIQNFQWEFNLVADQNVNAFCMPGGKIVVYEGLLPITQNESALAVVLGHEIAHAVAKHSAEQMSKKMRQQYATQIGGAVLGQIAGQSTASIATAIAQQGFQFANLKYSRDDETEADHIGLIFAAMAGYDPAVAVPFWQRMAALGGGSKSDIFSDHPSDTKRIAAIQALLPTANKYYQASGYAPVQSVRVGSAAKSSAKSTKKTGKKSTRK
ncbi:M48 family metallopeptidase [Prevotella sp.]|uniref:M48 family metallopeptidase n=1 Tax=Prevotella sp. TaxID=59823 RepID=UPI002F93D7BA